MANNTTLHSEITDLAAANCVDCASGIDEGRCVDPNHLHAPIYCWFHEHTYGEHEVGGMCLGMTRDGEDVDCFKQWFFEKDWLTQECRNDLAVEYKSYVYRAFCFVDRIMSGWAWRNAWDLLRNNGRNGRLGPNGGRIP